MGYHEICQADSPLLVLRMSGEAGTYSGSYSSVVGAIASSSDTATQFTAGAVTAAVDLSAYSQVTFECWAWLIGTDGASGDEFLAEYMSGNMAGEFAIDIGLSGNPGASGVYVNPSDDFRKFARPAQGVWHHMMFGFDKAAPGGLSVFYLNAVSQSFLNSPSAPGGMFGNDAIYLASRGAASLFLTAKIDEVRLYAGLPTAAMARRHYSEGLASAGLKRPTRVRVA